MTRDDIIRIARQVGMQGMLTDVVTTFDELERFANLVAAAEREACAKLCADDGMLWGARYAAKIRARGKG